MAYDYTVAKIFGNHPLEFSVEWEHEKSELQILSVLYDKPRYDWAVIDAGTLTAVADAKNTYVLENPFGEKAENYYWGVYVWRQTDKTEIVEFDGMRIPIEAIITKLEELTRKAEENAQEARRAFRTPEGDSDMFYPPKYIRANEIAGFDAEGRPAVGFKVKGVQIIYDELDELRKLLEEAKELLELIKDLVAAAEEKFKDYLAQAEALLAQIKALAEELQKWAEYIGRYAYEVVTREEFDALKAAGELKEKTIYFVQGNVDIGLWVVNFIENGLPALQAELDSLQGVIGQAEGDLSELIQSVKSSLDTEITRAFNAEAALSSALSVESSARESADVAITARLDDIVVNAGASAEAVQANLTAEIQRAKAAEAANASAIEAETSARQTADTQLSQLVELTKEQIKSWTNEQIAAHSCVTKRVVDSLSDVTEDGVLYLVRVQDTEENNLYDEYLYINGKPERVGSRQIDLSNYMTKLDGVTLNETLTLALDNETQVRSEEDTRIENLLTTTKNEMEALIDEEAQARALGDAQSLSSYSWYFDGLPASQTVKQYVDAQDAAEATARAAADAAEATARAAADAELAAAIARQESPFVITPTFVLAEQTTTLGSDTTDNASNVSGWYGYMKNLIPTDEQPTDSEEIIPIALSFFRRSGTTTNGALALYARILRLNEAGDAWTVAWQSTNTVVQNNQTIAGGEMGEWKLQNVDGRGAIPVSENIIVCFSASATAAATSYNSIGGKTTSDMRGVFSGSIPTDGTAPGTQNYSLKTKLRWAKSEDVMTSAELLAAIRGL